MDAIEVGVPGCDRSRGAAVRLAARAASVVSVHVARGQRALGRQALQIGGAVETGRRRSPAGSGDRIVDACVPGRGPKVVFSGLDASVAGDIERAFAEAGHIVVSNARNFRMDPLVPLLIPGSERRSPER